MMLIYSPSILFDKNGNMKRPQSRWERIKREWRQGLNPNWRTNLAFIAVATLALLSLTAGILAITDIRAASAEPPAAAAEFAPKPEEPHCLESWCRCTIERVKDGDTFVADIHLPFGGVVLDDRTVRLGYDAWEISRRRRTVEVTAEEIHKGHAAAADLADLFGRAKSIWLAPDPDRTPDPYGRVDAICVVVDSDGHAIRLADWMKNRGHLRGGGACDD